MYQKSLWEASILSNYVEHKLRIASANITITEINMGSGGPSQLSRQALFGSPCGFRRNLGFHEKMRKEQGCAQHCQEFSSKWNGLISLGHYVGYCNRFYMRKVDSCWMCLSFEGE